MTELEAVNILLSVIGEAPIEGFADEGRNEITDAALARRTLAEVDLDVQSEGWNWNKEYEVELVKTSNGTITLPSNTLKCQFRAESQPDNRYVARGLRIYDRVERTFQIEKEKITADVLVVRLPWDEVPHTAQQYIAIRAARIYGARFINSNVIFTYTNQDEAYARAMLMREEEATAHNNMLWGTEPIGVGYRSPEGLRHRWR